MWTGLPYLIFVIFLHRQNFWRIKFTPKNANFCQFFANFCQFTPKFAPKNTNFCQFLPIFCQFLPIYTEKRQFLPIFANFCQFFALHLKKITQGQKKNYTGAARGAGDKYERVGFGSCRSVEIYDQVFFGISGFIGPGWHRVRESSSRVNR